MTNFILFQHKHTPQGIDIRGAVIFDTVARKQVCTINAATGKGWKSSKAIIVDFPYTETSEGYVCDVLEVSDEVGEALIERFANVSYKIFDPYPGQTAKACAMVALLNTGLISDPDDTSGQFSRQ